MKSNLRIKVFVDTNVLIDYLVPAREKHDVAVALFGLIFTNRIEASFTTQSLLDASYILHRYPGFSDSTFRAALSEIIGRSNVDSINRFHLREALQDPVADLEDNAQLAFAFDQCCDILLTHDAQLLSRPAPTPLQMMTPEAFLEKCRG